MHKLVALLFVVVLLVSSLIIIPQVKADTSNSTTSPIIKEKESYYFNYLSFGVLPDYVSINPKNMYSIDTSNDNSLKNASIELFSGNSNATGKVNEPVIETTLTMKNPSSINTIRKWEIKGDLNMFPLEIDNGTYDSSTEVELLFNTPKSYSGITLFGIEVYYNIHRYCANSSANCNGYINTLENSNTSTTTKIYMLYTTNGYTLSKKLLIEKTGDSPTNNSSEYEKNFQYYGHIHFDIQFILNSFRLQTYTVHANLTFKTPFNRYLYENLTQNCSLSMNTVPTYMEMGNFNFNIKNINLNATYTSYELDIANITNRLNIDKNLVTPKDLEIFGTTNYPSIILRWKALNISNNDYNIYYKVYRNGICIASHVEPNTIESTYVLYEDKNVKYRETYSYYVKAFININYDYTDYPLSSLKSESLSITAPDMSKTDITNINYKLYPNPEVEINWNSIKYIDEYKIYKGSNQFNLHYITTVSKNSFIDKNVTYDNTYYYAIAGYNPRLNYTGKLSTINGITIPVPAPRDLTISSTTLPSVHLIWKPSPSASKYMIYRGTSSGGESYYATTTATSYTDTNVISGNTYYYYIIAEAPDGHYSKPSVEVSIKVVKKEYIAPEHLRAEAHQSERGLFIYLSWTGVSNAKEYKIYRGTQKGKETFAYTTNRTYFIDYNVQENITYYYYVTAIYNGTESGKSNEIMITANNGATSKNPIEIVSNSYYGQPYFYASVGTTILAVLLGIIAYKKRR